MTDYTINTDKAFADLLRELSGLYGEHRYLLVSVEIGKTRTSQQNRALHKYCTLLAKALNDAGWDMPHLLGKISKQPCLPWSKHTVKERLWRPVQVALTGKESTTEPKRPEYGEIYEALNRVISTTTGVHVPWPHRDEHERPDANQG